MMLNDGSQIEGTSADHDRHSVFVCDFDNLDDILRAFGIDNDTVRYTYLGVSVK
jgi:hypothetical protein